RAPWRVASSWSWPSLPKLGQGRKSTVAVTLHSDGLGGGRHHGPGLAVAPVDHLALGPRCALAGSVGPRAVELGGNAGQERPIPVIKDLVQRHDHDALLVPGRRTHRTQLVAARRRLRRYPAQSAGDGGGMSSHATPPWAIAQSSSASASAWLSSTGSKPRALAAAIISALPALPLPVACFLIVPTGTPWYGIWWCSHQAVRCAMKPP